MGSSTRALASSILATCVLGAAALVAASCTLDTSGQGGGPPTGSGGGDATSGAGGTGAQGGAGGAGGLGGAGGAGGAGGMAGAGGMGGAGGQGGTPEPVCSNGAVEAGEACDDGNQEQNDGCSPLCTLETPESCPGTSIPLAPPGITLTSTLQGRIDDQRPSCSQSGWRDVVYAVTPAVGGTLVATLQGAFNKSLSIRSVCASLAPLPVTEVLCTDGSGDLSATLWVHAGVTYYLLVDGSGDGFTLDLQLLPCGDGDVGELEDCDDPGDPDCHGCVRCDGPGEVLDPITKHCYLRQDTTMNVAAARSSCLAWGGDLVGISSQAEHDFIVQNAGLTGDTWSGGRAIQTGCAYAWVNGERWRSAWADNEPNNTGDECLSLWQSTGYRIDDRSCGSNLRSLCERVPVGGCGDGIVQPGEACDDGNTAAGDGCSPACAREIACTGAGSFQDPVTGHCYRVNAGTASWANAKAACEAMGGYLASIGSVEENGLIRQNIAADVWIGGWQAGLNNNVIWEAPALWCQSLWNTGEPNNNDEDCVELRTDGAWNDANCGSQRAYVCELPP